MMATVTTANRVSSAALMIASIGFLRCWVEPVARRDDHD
jgi:hypothetical protein